MSVKTQNVSRRHKAEETSTLLNLTAQYQSLPHQPHCDPSWKQLEFDATVPAPLGTSGQRAWTGRWPQTRNTEFFCTLSTQPQRMDVCSLEREMIVRFVWRRPVWRQSCSSLKVMGRLGGEQAGLSGRSLRLAFHLLAKANQRLKKHFHHPIKERLCYWCASTLWLEQLHHVTASFWEGKHILNTNFQIATAHVPCGCCLLLRIKIAVSSDFPNPNTTWLNSLFSLW